MSEQRMQVFSDDPTLAPYLAHYLQAPSCNILEDEGKFYLGSSYFEKLPLLSTSAQRKRYSAGLEAVLALTSPAFSTLAPPMKVEACKHAVLGILNGGIKLKYRRCGVLTRFPSVSPEVVGHGSDYVVSSSGQRIYTRTITIPTRVVLATGEIFFRVADRKQPSMKKLWNLARKNASVARTLYYYLHSDDPVAVRSALEEIREDIKAMGHSFNTWIVPEVPRSKMEEAWAVLHNALLTDEHALHSMARADKPQADLYKTAGTNMTLQKVREILHKLLLKWVTAKA